MAASDHKPDLELAGNDEEVFNSTKQIQQLSPGRPSNIQVVSSLTGDRRKSVKTRADEEEQLRQRETKSAAQESGTAAAELGIDRIAKGPS